LSNQLARKTKEGFYEHVYWFLVPFWTGAVSATVPSPELPPLISPVVCFSSNNPFLVMDCDPTIIFRVKKGIVTSVYICCFETFRLKDLVVLHLQVISDFESF
jgi:hypothetical protein